MQNKKIELVHGFLAVSEESTIVMEGAADAADYAGVVAERNGTIPHIIVLLDKPVTDLSAEEEEAVYEHIGSLYPKVAEALAEEVAAVLNGQAISNAEWQKSRRLGLFAIPEVPDEDHLYLGTGIIREEG